MLTDHDVQGEGFRLERWILLTNLYHFLAQPNHSVYAWQNAFCKFNKQAHSTGTKLMSLAQRQAFIHQTTRRMWHMRTASGTKSSKKMFLTTQNLGVLLHQCNQMVYAVRYANNISSTWSRNPSHAKKHVTYSGADLGPRSWHTTFLASPFPTLWDMVKICSKEYLVGVYVKVIFNRVFFILCTA